MDNYKRPNKTFQDNLSSDDIKKYLKDYAPVKDIYTLPLNTHLRYFTIKNGTENFRTGGYLSKLEQKKGYIMLTNGKVYWSVQENISRFFY